jgi:hypothetical protein
MTRSSSVTSSANSSHYDPSDNVSRADGSNNGAGGASSASGSGGSEGAGNVAKPEVAEYGCVPQVLHAAAAGGEMILLKNPLSVLGFVASFESAVECLTSSK